MRYIVCVTLGLPGVGKTCLKFLLMGTPPPELRTSTILFEAPIRIEIREISEVKLRASGEKWIEVGNEDMLEIIARMIILGSVKDPESSAFQVEEIDDEGSSTKAHADDVSSTTPKVESTNPLTKFIRRIFFKRKPVNKTPVDSKMLSVTESQHSVPVEACRTAVNAIMDKLMQIISRLREDTKPGEISMQHAGSNLSTSDWVLFSDCGGQPEYHELLPLFVRYISAALCVVRLPDQLDQVQAVEYYSQDKRLGASRQSQLSAKDTIRCLATTIQSFSTETEKPRIILVGTHRDVLEEKVKQASTSHTTESSSLPLTGSNSPPQCPVETLEEKNQALCEMLEPEFSDQLVYHSKDMRQLLFPLNTLHPGEKDETVAAAVRHAVETSASQEVDVPIWWYILELLLQELAKQLGRKVLSKLECLEVANLLGFTERALEAALKFFDKLNVIKYSPKVLPNVVFIDSQVPLDKVSELVRKSYLLRGEESASQEASTSPVEGKLWKHFRDQGVVSLELLKKFPRHYVTGIFTASDLAKFLIEQLVFAEIPTPSWVMPQSHSKSRSPPKDDGPYFIMPASIVTLSEAGLEEHRIFTTKAATLVVKFPEGSRRAGVFSCFAVHLIRHCGWDPLLDAKRPLYRNCIQFYVKQISPPCRVTVIDSHSFIEVHAKICVDATIHESAQILPIIKGAVFGGIVAACRALNYKQTQPEIAFICPYHVNSSDASSRHTASVTHNTFWCCDVDTDLNGRLDCRHLIWYGIALQSSLSSFDNSPSLHHQSSHSCSLQPNELTAALATPTNYSASHPLHNVEQASRSTRPAVEVIPPTVVASISHLPQPLPTCGTSQSTLSSAKDVASHPPEQALTSTRSTAQHIKSPASVPLVAQPLVLTATGSHPLSTPASASCSHLPQIPEYIPISGITSQSTRTSGTRTTSTSSRTVNMDDHESKNNSTSKTRAYQNVVTATSSSSSTPQISSLEDKPLSPTSLRLHRDATPTLAQLSLLTTPEGKKINIIKRMAPFWRDLGVLLDFDDNGTELDIIAKEHPLDPKACCMAMFQHWLKGNGRTPCTWRIIIDLIKDADQETLADEIETLVVSM